VLPVSRHWRLLSSGIKTKGKVGLYEPYFREDIFGHREPAWASRVEFLAGDSLVAFHGPVGEEMESGREVTIYYQPDHPEKHCIMTFGGLYLGGYSSLVLGLIIVWASFYLSFNHYRKKSKQKSRLPASSPSRRETGTPDPAGKHPKNHPRLPGISS
jgi:hypothetical protein